MKELWETSGKAAEEVSFSSMNRYTFDPVETDCTEAAAGLQ